MSRRVKDFIEIRECCSLDALIEKLVEVRDGLPAGSDAVVKMRGDDVFGRHMSVSFYREQTVEEAECDARYANAYRESREQELGYCEVSRVLPGKLRAVA